MKRTLIAVGLSVSALAASAQTPESRGALLYDNHCIACHNEQMHWRNNRAASDWTSLRALVRRWQGTAQLGWPDEDIDEVARYLNERFYHYERKSPPV